MRFKRQKSDAVQLRETHEVKYSTMTCSTTPAWCIKRRRRWQSVFQVAFLVGGFFTFVGLVLKRGDNANENFKSLSNRKLMQADTTDLSNDAVDTRAAVSCFPKSSVTENPDPLFPPDLFTSEQRVYGAIVLHIIGIVYVFVALAIVCNEFFVPALYVIIEKLQISEDIAGATIMAAGVSAPELFTSIIGVFISFDDVDIGIGKIVGSAVFNILFVIAICVLFSRTVLDLTWWPIFRDITFYSVALLMLVIFFLDSYVYWYESILMFFFYILYCLFMKVNKTFERFVKKRLCKNKVARECSTDQLVLNQLASIPTTQGSNRPSLLLQSMNHTVDSLHDGKVDEKTTYQSADGLSPDTRPDAQTHISGRSSQWMEFDHKDEQDAPKPIDLSWPDTIMKRIKYIVVAPIIFPLWITLPDTRSQRGKRFFIVTFIGSIIWISMFSYLMVWWATVVGETLSISAEIMGLTILAAGTSIPVVITSVIIARKGFGDMAVSFSIGRNIFAVCCGLPIPWLFFALFQLVSNFSKGIENPWDVEPIKVSAGGIACSIILLFSMLLFVLISIICARWKMTKGLGFAMFFLYIMFVVVSLSFQYNLIVCPV